MSTTWLPSPNSVEIPTPHGRAVDGTRVAAIHLHGTIKVAAGHR